MPQRAGREHHRPGDVAAAAEDDVAAAAGAGSAAQARGARARPARARSSASDGRRGKPEIAKGVELVARVRDEPRLDAIRRPGERHARRRARAAPPRPRAPAARGRPSRRPRSGTGARRAVAASRHRRDVKEDADRRRAARRGSSRRRRRTGAGSRSAARGRARRARLTAAWPQTSAVIPAASSFPNGSRQRSAIREARRRRRRANAAITTRRPDQAELLADDREDHVRVRLGQVVDLLDALRRAPRRRGRRSRGRSSPARVWKPAPCGSLHGSRKLKTRARRYGSNQIAARPRTRARAPRRRRACGAGVPATTSMPGEHQDDRDRRAEVGLEQDERAEDADDAARSGFHELAERPRRAACGRGSAAAQIGERELRELGRLERRRARRRASAARR